MKQNILCVNPYEGKGLGALQGVGGKQVPLGLCYIAAILEKEGHKVQIIDELVAQDAIEHISKNDPPSIIFLGVYPSCADRAKKVIDAAKEKNKDVLVVVGGAVGQKSTAAHWLDFLNADVVVLGEGEFVAPLLMKEKKTAWHKLNGICFKDGGKHIITGEPELIKDLDSLPFPAIHLLDLQRYKGPTEQGFFESEGAVTTSIMTARGCIFSCNFCGSGSKLGHSVRYRSPKNVVDEIEHYVKDLNICHFTVNDDTFSARIPRVIELCDMIIERGLDKKVSWIVQTRAEIGTPEMFKKMRQAGCVMVAFGVESGSDKVLKICNKKLDLANVLTGAKWARDAGMRIKAYFMVNLPGEEEEDFQKSVAFAKKLDPDYLWLSYFTPLPGTEFHRQLVEQNKVTNDEMRNHTFFSESRSPEIVGRYKRFLRSFYLRPAYILRFMKRFSWKECVYMMRMSVVFVKMQLGSNKAPAGH